MVVLMKAIERLNGRLEGIENRFSDKDRVFEAVVALKVREEFDRLRADASKMLPPPPT